MDSKAEEIAGKIDASLDKRAIEEIIKVHCGGDSSLAEEVWRILHLHSAALDETQDHRQLWSQDVQDVTSDPDPYMTNPEHSQGTVDFDPEQTTGFTPEQTTGFTPEKTHDEGLEGTVKSLRDRFQSARESGENPSISAVLSGVESKAQKQQLLQQLISIDMQFHAKRPDRGFYLDQLPEFRSEIEHLFEQLEVRERASSKRYLPVKFHAKGGLGAVYKAKDLELNRVVALKELQSKYAKDVASRERFVFEAQVTGSLEHPGIVPVYGLVKDESGNQFYAMQFIRGSSYQRVINEFHRDHESHRGKYLSREFKSLIRRLIEACNAIHFAHVHGVIHRDIKPDNVMIGKYGETLVVDWGLAKLIESSGTEETVDYESVQISSRESSATLAGSTVGTPQFMSPEQARGDLDNLGPGSDIYSLGATLFVVISGERPVDGKSVLEVVQNVREGRLRDLSAIAPGTPKALISVCRKAMAMNLEDRYLTANELADDLDRWLSDDAVHAHLPIEGPVERTGRWLRRHRSWTMSLAAALVCVAVVASAAALLINRARKAEEVAKQVAVENYELSRESIDRWLVESAEPLEYFPGTQSLRSELLKLAAEDYQRLANVDDRDDPSLILQRARVYAKLGRIEHLNNEFQEALQQYELAEGFVTRLKGNQALEKDIDRLAAYLDASRGLSHFMLGESELALQSYGGAIERLRKLPGAESQLARTLVDLGELHQDLGNYTDAEDLFKEAMDVYSASVQVAPQLKESALGKARAVELRARGLLALGRQQDAQAILRQTVQELRNLVGSNPDDIECLDRLASALVSKARIHRENGQSVRLVSDLKEAVRHYRALHTALPDVPRHTESLALTIGNLAIARYELDEVAEAVELFDESILLLSALRETYQGVARVEDELARNQLGLGLALLDLDEVPENSRAFFDSALSVYDGLVRENDPLPDYFERLAIAQAYFGRVAARFNNYELAVDAMVQSIDNLEQIIEYHPDLPHFSNSLAHARMEYGWILFDQGKVADARDQFQQAANLWGVLREHEMSSWDHALALLLLTCPLEDVADIVEATELARVVFERAPENPVFRATLGFCLGIHEDGDDALNEQRAKLLTQIREDPTSTAREALTLSALEPEEREGHLARADELIATHQPFNRRLLRLREMLASAETGESND